MVTKRTVDLPLICLVCSDTARGINFDLMTCMSCKTFFRRHVLKSTSNLQCQFENNCVINRETRGNCSACRLQKCFILGMDPKLVGQRFYSQVKSKPIHSNKKPHQVSSPLPLSLLRNDRSTLTTNEWTLLTNILQIYDSINLIPQTKHLLEQQAMLPLKLRSKLSTSFNIIKYFFTLYQPLLERTPFFQNLPTDACRSLIRNNSQTFGTFISIYLMRETNALDYPAFQAGCTTIYGDEIMKGFHQSSINLEKNGMFLKIMLFILAFSTNCSVVIPDNTENYQTIVNSLSIYNVQNVFITMFWKYLVYQYGFIVAVRWFDSFIKYSLNIIQNIYEQPNNKHNDLIDTIVEETTRSLTIED